MRTLVLTALGCAAMAGLAAQNNKEEEKEPQTQTLELPKELPPAVTGETRRLVFVSVPLSAKGLLSQQVRDGLKALGRLTGGNPVIHIRAFVAGAGDLRRVRDLVSETYAGRHQALPALSLIRAGGLPLAGAQVQFEAVASNRKKEVNPGGLAFLSGRAAASDGPLDPVAPLAVRSLADLAQEVKAAGVQPGDVLRVTCYLSSLEDLAATRTLVATQYPRAGASYIQTQRAPAHAVAACEAVARLQQAPAEPLRIVNVDGLSPDQGQSDVALVGARRVILTGTQTSFGYEEKDSRLAFERLRASLAQAGAPASAIACAHYYALAPAIASQVRKLRLEMLDSARPPAGAFVMAEGLASMDAGFAVDAIAVRSEEAAAGRILSRPAVR
jgi:enamine deaminase RidA (YjgF/YER057c/UK114 family)